MLLYKFILCDVVLLYVCFVIISESGRINDRALGIIIGVCISLCCIVGCIIIIVMRNRSGLFVPILQTVNSHHHLL